MAQQMTTGCPTFFKERFTYDIDPICTSYGSLQIVAW